MALRSSDENVRKQLSTTYRFFLSVGQGRALLNATSFPVPRTSHTRYCLYNFFPTLPPFSLRKTLNNKTECSPIFRQAREASLPAEHQNYLKILPKFMKNLVFSTPGVLRAPPWDPAFDFLRFFIDFGTLPGTTLELLG